MSRVEMFVVFVVRVVSNHKSGVTSRKCYIHLQGHGVYR